MRIAKFMCRQHGTILAAAILAATGCTLARAEADAAKSSALSLKWELEEVFPLFPRARVDALRAIRGKSPSDLYAALTRSWAPGKPIVVDVESTAYDRTTGTYKLDYLKRDGDDIGVVFRVEGGLGLSDLRCTWSAQVDGGKQLPLPADLPCDAPVRFSVPLGANVQVAATMTMQGRKVVIGASARATQRVVVALGDSYASGEGNPDIPALYKVKLDKDGRQGTTWPFTHDFCGVSGGCAQPEAAKEPAAVWWDRECHRSLVSWPVMSALWRALDDEVRQTRHVILSYACSGALLDDGGFLAQIKSNVMARNRSFMRDGAERQQEPEQRFVYSTKRSQVNAMYDDLCRGQERRQRLVNVPTRLPIRAWVEDCEHMVYVDDLLVSMGGNDLGFGSIAMGVLVASDPRPGLLNGPGLWLVRKLMGAASIDDAADMVSRYARHYAPGIRALMDAARVDAHRTTIVSYPNPVVTAQDDNLGCTQRAGDEVKADEGGSMVRPQRARVRDANLVIGSLLPEMSWHLIRPGWTVEIKGGEVARFRDVFSAIEKMQRDAKESEASATRGVGLARFGPDHQFAGRRMCDPVAAPDAIALPLFFCEGPKHNCNVSKGMGGGQWSARSPTEWRHYPVPDSAPRRIIVNWLNDAMLAGRGWLKEPSSDELAEALGGAIHPTAEAHSGAADEVVRVWRERSMVAP